MLSFVETLTLKILCGEVMQELIDEHDLYSIMEQVLTLPIVEFKLHLILLLFLII